MAKKITPAERRHMDYLRHKGLKVGRVYETRLIKLRRAELRRLLTLCQDWGDPGQWSGVIEDHLSEQYLFDWYKGLFIDTGMPRAKSTARDLSRGKATPEEDYWLRTLTDYALDRAGSEITLVSGTFKEALVDIVRKNLVGHAQDGVEKLAKRIYADWGLSELWQARRIAQTEAMIGMADASAIAAGTLDVGFTKQWCTSGLGNTRDSHLIMDGVTVAKDEPFELEGGRMMYPHDGSMGASAAEIINCACDVIRRPL